MRKKRDLPAAGVWLLLLVVLVAMEPSLAGYIDDEEAAGENIPVPYINCALFDQSQEHRHAYIV